MKIKLPKRAPKQAKPEAIVASHGIVATARGDRRIRRSTVVVVLLIAAFAAYISYRHAYELASHNGEDTASAWAWPLTIDGLIFSASMVILRANRHAVKVPKMAWLAMALGILATLGANVAHGIPYGPVGMATSAWPAIALVVSFEMLMRLFKPVITGEHETAPEAVAVEVPQAAPIAPESAPEPSPAPKPAPKPIEAPKPAPAPVDLSGDERYATGLAAYHESVVRPGRPLSQRDLAAVMGLKNRDLATQIIRDYKAAADRDELAELLAAYLPNGTETTVADVNGMLLKSWAAEKTGEDRGINNAVPASAS